MISETSGFFQYYNNKFFQIPVVFILDLCSFYFYRSFICDDNILCKC